MLRDLMTLIQEAIEETEVDSSHIQSIEHNGENLYVHFKNGAIYEYDGVTEQMAQRMLNAPSKGRFLWAYIRDKYPYRKVPTVPQPKNGSGVEMTYDDEKDQWVPVPEPVQAPAEVPVGYQFRAPDGDTYIWKGAQWVNVRSGRIARRDIAQKISSIAARLIKIKGE